MFYFSKLFYIFIIVQSYNQSELTRLTDLQYYFMTAQSKCSPILLKHYLKTIVKS